MQKKQNKILVKLPNKKKSFWLKLLSTCAVISGGIWFLDFFILSNDLINQPFFPSTLLSYINLTISWSCAFIIWIIFVLYFLKLSKEWIRTYNRFKFTKYSLATFLWISAFCLATFFGSVAKSIANSCINGISSKMALTFDNVVNKRISISESHFNNPTFGQLIQLTRGKTTVNIIDPVSYKLSIELTIDRKIKKLDSYCLVNTSDEPHLRTTIFEVKGQESFLGFRCTSGCELYQYFNTINQKQLSIDNFDSCRRVYSKQESI